MHHNQDRQHFPSDLTCHICGKEGHVPIPEPRGSEIISIFCLQVTCILLDRFQLLRKKGLRFQCLYPGAKTKDMRHSERKFQIGYTC